ncbi:hypothetical protein PA598K_03430 [Paenibacillus sp. 598K]|nr:hypothetical protein PA598K_03430 [Paenibacillus sp. 598K]
MTLPEWFVQAVRERMSMLYTSAEEVTNTFEQDAAQMNGEGDAVTPMEAPAGATVGPNQGEPLRSQQRLADERMYIQGVKDGLQLAIAILDPPPDSKQDRRAGRGQL